LFKKSTLALGAVLSAGLAFTASAGTTIKVGHGAAEAFHMHRALLKFEELVEAGSGGEIDVQIFPSSQMDSAIFFLCGLGSSLCRYRAALYVCF